MAGSNSSQQHVLANLERVKDRPYKVVVNSPHKRYELDGQDCSQEVTGLVVRGLVSVTNDGILIPTVESSLPSSLFTGGERQAPKGNVLDQIRATLMAPVQKHKDPQAASRVDKPASSRDR